MPPLFLSVSVSNAKFVKKKSTAFILLVFILCFFFIDTERSLQISKSAQPQIKNDGLAKNKLDLILNNISVKVLQAEGNLWGTGVIVKSDNNTYTVVTNHHVISAEKHLLQLETVDGAIHEAQLVNNFFPMDLVLLQFTSKKKYEAASLNPAFTLANLYKGQKVFLAGFPILEDGLIIKDSKIKALLPQPTKKGFQIGFSGPTEPGMSGGSLINEAGDVIGIIGKSTYPNSKYNAYEFNNIDSKVFPQEILIESSFAIPVEVLLAKSNSVLISQDFNWRNSDQPSLIENSLELSENIPDINIERNNRDFYLNISEQKTYDTESIELENDVSKENFQVVDLDGDLESEILVNFYLSNSCPGNTMSYLYVLDDEFYTNEIEWMHRGGFSIEDLDNDGKLEILGFDINFACRFSESYQTQDQNISLPRKIYQYDKNKLKDVTDKKQFRQIHKDHALKMFQLYKNRDNWQSKKDDLKSILAAYSASKYLMGEGKDGEDSIRKFYQFKDIEKFVEELDILLEENGYI